MQLFLNSIDFTLIVVGQFLSIALALLFGVLHSRDRISFTATIYSCGAFLAFGIGSIVFTGGLLIGPRNLIGMLGGYLLLGFSCIQAIYDLKKGKK